MMQVEVFAKTQLANVNVRRRLDDFDSADIDIAHEYAGRQCYESFNKPNKATATNDAYLKLSIIDNGHTSVLEHCSVSFLVSGVSRNMLLELERHRHLSFSVVSQRFVDSSNIQFVVPPAAMAADVAAGYTPAEVEASFQTLEVFKAARDSYKVSVEDMRELGHNNKQAREAARAVLPGCAETKFIVTGNIRAWREIIGKRTAPGADAEIQLFAGKVRDHLKGIAPASMQ